MGEGRQISYYICTVLVLDLDCAPVFLLNSTIGPTRKFRCVNQPQTPQCSGAVTANVCSNMKFICGFSMTVLLGRCWLQLSIIQTAATTEMIGSLNMLSSSQACNMDGQNLPLYQSNPCVVWFVFLRIPNSLYAAGSCKAFISHLSLLVYYNCFYVS